MDMAWQIYLATRRYYHLPRDNFPLGIIAGTFELDSKFWYDRNVVGRLLAVTMGAAQEVYADDGNELYGLYRAACKGVGFEDALCNHYGLPFISWSDYKEKWTNVWTLWKSRICDRLTTPTEQMLFVRPNERSEYQRYPNAAGRTTETFWDQFGTRSAKRIVDLGSNETFSSLSHWPSRAALMNRFVAKSGIVMDLTLPNQNEQVLGPNFPLLQQMHMMGFNLVQLRLANDDNIGYSPKVFGPAEQYAQYFQSDAKRRLSRLGPSIGQIKENLVEYATRLVSVSYEIRGV